MAEVLPFQALRYNPAAVGDVAKALTPPYDVISQSEKIRFHEVSEYNVIRLILGRELPGDNESANWRTRAGETFRKWREQKVLTPDPQPALYAYDIEYDLNGRRLTRPGLIAAVRLEELGAGGIRPHEKTYTKTKQDRLLLIKACGANFSPIWSLFSDPADEVGQALKEFRHEKPLVDAEDSDGISHRLWSIADRDAIRWASGFFQDRELFIADGHHRYETALNYYKFLSGELQKDISDKAPAYVMMYLSSMESKGLTILPAHRLLTSWPEGLPLDAFLSRLDPYFVIEKFTRNESNKTRLREKLRGALQEKASSSAIGISINNAEEYLLLTLRDGARDCNCLADLALELRSLDVVVLARLIFGEGMGLEEKDLDNEFFVKHSSSFNEALDIVECGEAAAAFLLNPTPVEQMKQVAEASLVMPRKSTYFYPKVITGLVFNELDPDRRMYLP